MLPDSETPPHLPSSAGGLGDPIQVAHTPRRPKKEHSDALPQLNWPVDGRTSPLSDAVSPIQACTLLAREQ